jgi:protein involved in polysaccharide export with SLBB domain
LRSVTLVFAAVSAVGLAYGQTQSIPNASTTIGDLLQQRSQGQQIDTTPPPEQGQPKILKPNFPAAYRIPPGPLEKVYSKRAGTDLRQFGYESFGRPSEVTQRQTGALQDTYLLGPGDQIVVDIRGQESQSYRVSVNRDGTVILPRLKPVLAGGRRLGEFRADLEQRIAEAFVATQAFITVGAVRQLSVFVAGEVNAPGSITVNALNSPIDALLLAGGIKKSGSLRNIIIERGSERIPFDLYGVLAGISVPLEASLADGDKIIVPPTGPTVAIVGEVARPGIFELAPTASAIGAQALIELAGGHLVGGAKRLTVLRVHPDGTEAFEPGATQSGTSLHKSEILFVLPAANVARGRLALEGQVRIPGSYDLSRTPTLRALLASPDALEEDPFVLFAVISRKDPVTLSRTLIPFAPIQIVRGQFDLDLQDDDVVRIFSAREIRDLVSDLSIEQANRDLSNQDLRTLRSVRLRSQQPGQPQTGGTTQPGTASPNQQLPQGTVGAALAGQVSQIGQVGIQQQQQQRQQQSAGEQVYPGYAPGQQIQGGESQPLQPGQTAPQGVQLPYPQDGDLAPEDRLIPLEEGAYPDRMRVPAYPQRRELTSRTLMVDLRDPTVRNKLADYRTSVIGAIELPGEYLIAPGVGLDAVIGAVGGLTIAADLTGVEITSTAYDSTAGVAKTSRTSFNLARDQLERITIQPGDVVRIRELFSERDGGQIIVRGQVRFPGKFDLLRGERLSSVLARAGGFTEIAYPYGAVFTRRSAARAEEDGYRRAAQELERQFTVLVADQNVSPQGIQFIRDTIYRLQEAEGVGRVSVEADTAKLAARPERDTILEPDDFLFIPRRPNAVSVTGEVLSAGSYLFASGSGGAHYINLAGGFGPAADRGRTFVLMPDGTARPLFSSIFSFSPSSVVPGATVIVPRDLKPFKFRQLALDLSQIFSQLAVSAASIAVISRSN